MLIQTAQRPKATARRGELRLAVSLIADDGFQVPSPCASVRRTPIRMEPRSAVPMVGFARFRFVSCSCPRLGSARAATCSKSQPHHPPVHGREHTPRPCTRATAS
ncbi:unnamed protein product [Urochloa decumbens]|uniref:Uncharacterized protein n=1 Tax=Urochloa decumbens TaxID=240449 RepID=A0ABC9EUT3_9POAL